MNFQTRLRLDKTKIKQLETENLELSGNTNVYGVFSFESGSTLYHKENFGSGKVLMSDENGKLTLQKPKNIITPYKNISINQVDTTRIADWDVSDGVNGHLILSDEDIFLSINNLEDGLSGDLYISVTDDSSITITSDPYFYPSYVDGSFQFNNNKIELGIGKYHLAFTVGNGWIHINMAGYNGLYGTYVNSNDFQNHINDNTRHLTIGEQTIQGKKIFIDIPELPDSNPIDDNQATRKKYVDDNFVLNTTLFDNNDKIITSLLPDSILGAVKYKGTWDASTNTPPIPVASEDNLGQYYKTTTQGTYNTVEYRVGDWIISDGVGWSKVDNTDNVITVNSKDGVVTLYGTDITMASGDSTTLKSAIDSKATTTYVNTVLTNLEIGGTNLLKGTKDFSGDWTNLGQWTQNGTYMGFTVMRRSSSWNGFYQQISVKNGEKYVISFYARKQSTAGSVFMNCASTSVIEQGIATGYSEVPIDNSENWQKIVVHINVIADGTIIAPALGLSSSGHWVEICGLKLERGNKATDWSPAPEDKVDVNVLGTAAYKNTGTSIGNVMEVGAFGLGGALYGYNINRPNVSAMYSYRSGAGYVDGGSLGQPQNGSTLLIGGESGKNESVALWVSRNNDGSVGFSYQTGATTWVSNEIAKKSYVDDNFMKVGDFGVGKTGNVPQTNLTTEAFIKNTPSSFFAYGSSGGGPTQYGQGIIIGYRVAEGNTYSTAIAFPTTENRMFIRNHNNGTASDWAEVALKKAEFVDKGTASFTLTLSDAYKHLISSGNVNNVNVTIPSNASVGFEIGTMINVYATGVGAKQVVGATGVTVLGNSYIQNRRVVQLVKLDTNQWIVIGGAASELVI